MHFPFSSNISELSECELVVGKVGTMFPFIYIQCEEQREERREGAWQIVGRAFPVSSIQTCQVHSNIAHHLKLSEHIQKVIEPLTSSHHDVRVKHCAAESAKFVSTFLTLFSIRISSRLLLLGAELLLTLSFLPAQSVPVQGWGKMSRGHIFSSRFSDSFGSLINLTRAS